MKITRIKTTITRGRKPLVMVYPEELDKLEALAIDDWISVEDELPKDGEKVIAVFYFGVDIAMYEKKGFYLEYNPYASIWEKRERASHWRPLPTPPKGE